MTNSVCISYPTLARGKLVKKPLSSPSPPPLHFTDAVPRVRGKKIDTTMTTFWEPLLIKFVFSFLLTFFDSSLLSSTSSVLSYTYLCPKTSVFSF